MTPVPSSPVALLDQLDELRAKATPGPWRVGYESCDCGGGYPCGHEDYPYELVGPKRTDPSPNFPDYDRLVSEIAQLSDADAALIVAAVNALDGLVTVVREMWDEHDGRTCCDRTGPSFDGVELCDTRQMIESALTALSVTP